ncbi:MAG TPA: M23 family metallopeptidase [bacterium]|nr:M23 family metallopeptidase [bacterium]
MADHARLAAAGLFLALTLAAVPALLPINLAGNDASPRAEAAAPVGPLVRLRAGNLTPAQTAIAAEDPTVAPDGVLHFAIAEAAPLSHTVEAGETLWRISQDAGIGVEALAAANHLTLGSLLHRGQVLIIPPVDPSSANAASPVLTHEVASGETLWGIARASGLRVETLATANHLSLDSVLHPGQALVIPSQDGPVQSAGARQARFRGPAVSVGAQKLTFQNAPLLGDSWPLARPSEGMITSPFGWRIHPIFGTREFHTGLDIANRAGTPVRAAEGGIVRFVGWMGGYGRLIIVTHANGLETSYSHLSAMLVALGQRVGRGQVLGRMGSTGWSTGPHLFFEVRRNGVAVDPTPFLQGMRGAAPAPPVPAPPAPASSAPSPRPARPDAAGAVSTPASAVAPAVSAPPSAPAAAEPSEEHRIATEPLQSPPPPIP